MRWTPISISSAIVANRLPRVVAWAATLCERPAITVSSCSAASRPRRTSAATARSRTTSSERRTCSCSTFSVRSREVMPLWMCSWPASGGELLDARLHVVAGDPLARGDGVEVDPVDDRLVGLDDAVGHVDAEVALRLQHRDPQLALEDDLVLGRPDRGEVGAGVAGGQDVGDAHVLTVFHCCSAAGSRVHDIGARQGLRQPRAAAPSTTPSGSAAMSRRHWAPAKLMLATPSYALARASATSAPTRAHGQHPTAGGHQARVGARGAGVDDVHVDLLGQRLGADDDVARARALRVAGAGHDDGDRRPVGEGRSRERRDRSPRAAACSSTPSGDSSSASTGWMSGSPKRTLNSMTFGPAAVRASPT